MLFKRYYDDKLAQASYLLACERSGEALIVDPNRDTQRYIDEARKEGVRICYVTETHIHADFVSGSRELAHRTGARLLLSAEGGPDWNYGFADADAATLLHDGDELAIGNIRVKAVHTPGHTPEHMVFLVTDLSSSTEPVGMLSGDFIFVGDVGRPDLLEKAAKQAGTMTGAAKDLFASLNKIASLPDHLQIWPGHGAGSACGKALGSMPQSTLGYERISNWALRVRDEETFVREVLSGQPTPPKYFAEMKRVNRDGPALLAALPNPERMQTDDLARFLAAGGVVADTRHASRFVEQHIPGTLSIPLNKSFTKWAGELLPYDKDVVLVIEADAVEAARTAARDLALIGFDRLAGYATSDAIAEWTAGGKATEAVGQITVADLAKVAPTGSIQVLDVRDPHEVHAGHLPGAQAIPLGQLKSRLGELDPKKPVAVYCQTGSRSVIASGVLLANGFTDVRNVPGGYAGWRKAGLPVEAAEGMAVARDQ